MLNLVIPVSRADVALLPQFIELFAHLGGSPNAPVIFSAAKSVSFEAHEAADRIRHLCPSVQVHKLEAEPRGGWPMACNMHFKQTVSFLRATQNRNPWYWLELDNTLMRTGWADELWVEYQRSKKAFMGAVVPTRSEDPQTKRISMTALSPHMVGTGIYPPASQYVHLVPIWNSGTSTAFDIFTRRNVNRSVHNTALIQHMWSTVNYREKDGEIICENGPDNQFGTDHAAPVRPDACVVHGCKDGSLGAIVLSREPQSEHVPTPAYATPQLLPRAKQQVVLKKMAPGAFQLAPVGVQLPTQEASQPVVAPVAAVAPEPTAPAQVPAAEPSNENYIPPSESSQMLDKIRQIVIGRKSYRPSEVADKVGMKGKTKDLLLIIREARDEFDVRGPANWISRRAA